MKLSMPTIILLVTLAREARTVTCNSTRGSGTAMRCPFTERCLTFRSCFNGLNAHECLAVMCNNATRYGCTRSKLCDGVCLEYFDRIRRQCSRESATRRCHTLPNYETERPCADVIMPYLPQSFYQGSEDSGEYTCERSCDEFCRNIVSTVRFDTRCQDNSTATTSPTFSTPPPTASTFPPTATTSSTFSTPPPTASTFPPTATTSSTFSTPPPTASTFPPTATTSSTFSTPRPTASTPTTPSTSTNSTGPTLPPLTVNVEPLADDGHTGPRLVGKLFSLNCVVRPREYNSSQYTWFVNTTPVVYTDRVHQSGHTLILSDLEESDSGYYTCQATINNSTQVNSSLPGWQLRVVMAPPPTVAVQPPDDGHNSTFVVGQNFSLNCVVSPREYYNSSDYAWFVTTTRVNNTALVNQRGHTLNFVPLQESDSGYYTCQATVNSMQVNSSQPGWQLRVRAPPTLPPFPLLTVVPPDDDHPPIVGQRYLLNCVVNSGERSNREYVWFVNGTPVIYSPRVHREEHSLIFTRLEESDSGYYTCQTTVNSATVNSSQPGWPLRGEQRRERRAAGDNNNLDNVLSQTLELLLYCAHATSQDGYCSLTPFFQNFSCFEENHADVCAAICKTIAGRLSVCCSEHREFCDRFKNDSINLEISLAQNISMLEELGVEEVVDSIESILDSLRRRNGTFVNDTAENMAAAVDGLIDEESITRWQGRREGSAMNMTRIFDDMIVQLGTELVTEQRNESFTYYGKNTIISVAEQTANISLAENYTFPNRKVAKMTKSKNISVLAEVSIPYRALCEDRNNCSVVLGVTVSDNLAQYLQEEITKDKMDDINKTEVVSVFLSIHTFLTKQPQFEQHPVEMVFTPMIPEEVNTSNQTIELKCKFLVNNTKWSTEGVTTEYMNNGDIKCLSTHLTSFAILMSVTGVVSGTEEEEFALMLVGYIGCGISIFCLCLTIVILFILRKKLNKGALLYVHLNLALAMLLALVVFVAGLQTAIKVPVLCTVVAALIQYFFLCTFCWMLSEGIMLYLLVVKVFGNAAKRWYLLLFLGWGLPIPIVALSAGLLHDSYRSKTYCWISANVSKPAIWTFVGPVVLVIAINTVILVLTIIAIVRGKKHGGAEMYVKNRDLAKSAIKGSVVLLPLLGLTWVFGLFAVNSNTTLFAWLFTIANSLQGFFIFLLHVVRNDVFINKVKHFFSRNKKYRHSSMAVTSSNEKRFEASNKLSITEMEILSDD